MEFNPKARKQIYLLKDAFFSTFSGSLLSPSEKPKKLSVENFYDRLKQAHEHENFENIPTDVQHRNLRPILRPYQVKGIRWMLKRELETESFPSLFTKLRSNINSQVLYFDEYTLQFHREPPELIEVPSGGLLTGKFLTDQFDSWY